MRLALSAALLAATPAFAQPIPQPDRPGACLVSITQAPDDVREVIEAWVHSEPRCTTLLEVRVVQTDEGLYLFARSQDGRVRERVVPDPQSAGVLVASWAADDWVTPLPPVRMVEPIEEVANLECSPVGDAAGIAVSLRPAARQARWLTIGATALAGESDGVGLRGELDLVTRGAWTLGAAVQLSARDMRGGYDPMYGWDINALVFDVRAVAVGSRTWGSGRWTMRASIGAGVIRTDAGGSRLDLPDPLPVNTTFHSTVHHTVGIFPVAEASLQVSRELGASWAISAGPVVTLLSERLQSPSDPMQVLDRGGELVVFGGVRHRM